MESRKVAAQGKLRERFPKLIVMRRDEGAEADIPLKKLRKALLPAADAAEELIAEYRLCGIKEIG